MAKSDEIGRVRIISRSVLCAGVLTVRGEEHEFPKAECANLVALKHAEWVKPAKPEKAQDKKGAENATDGSNDPEKQQDIANQRDPLACAEGCLAGKPFADASALAAHIKKAHK